MRVLAAMSGGVDSAVAAARAVDAGFDVTGVHLALARNPQTYRTGARGCCTLEDSRDARRAADVIGIPFYVWDMAEQFHAEVVDDFVREYAAGRTPNPCLRCNEKIKFAAVLDRAVALGFDAVVTGHHARLGADGLLRRSVDLAKDQSYVLAVLTRAQLDRAVFPLGDSTKAQVRQEAAARGLAVADKPDSHDICFIADGDTRGFLAGKLGSAPGDIVDSATGAVLGHHDGAYAYTVGQRRGLDLRVAAPDRKPRYVLSITPVTNTVTVGPAEALDVTTIEADRPVWTARVDGPGGVTRIGDPAHIGARIGDPAGAAARVGDPATAAARMSGPGDATAPTGGPGGAAVRLGGAAVRLDGATTVMTGPGHDAARMGGSDGEAAGIAEPDPAGVSWASGGPIGRVDCMVQLRAHGETLPAEVTVREGVLTARLHRPARGVATGQAIVCYRTDPAGDVVLGSATIASAA